MARMYTDEEIVVQYRQAMRPYEMIGILADLCGMYDWEICDILRRHGVEPAKRRRGPQKFPEKSMTRWDPDPAKMTAYYDQGCAAADIAKAMGVSASVVYRWYRQNDMPLRKRSKHDTALRQRSGTEGQI